MKLPYMFLRPASLLVFDLNIIKFVHNANEALVHMHEGYGSRFVYLCICVFVCYHAS